MRKNHLQSWAAISALAGFLCVGAPALAQSTTDKDNRPVTGNEIYHRSVVEFDQFLDSHHETADQLRKEPDLVLNDTFLKSHPELQNYLTQHPEMRDQMRKDPNAFMAQEAALEQHGDNDVNGDRDRDRNGDRDRDRSGDRRDVASFNRFLDSHRETAQQLRKQPDLVLNDTFLKSHPALQEYLQQHPAVSEQIRQNPNAFMAQESTYEQRGDQRADQRSDNDARGDQRADNDANGDRDANHNRDVNRDRNGDRPAVANFDKFLDSHRETAEQLRRDPSQINNDEFVKNHPALQAYLQQHPEVRQDVSQNPNAFMQQEARYDRTNNGMNRDSDSRRQFGEFLGGHADVSRQLSENPSLVKNHEYMDNHPELRSYLSSHPDVQQRLTADPDNFVKSAQQFNGTTTPGQTTTKPGETTKSPTPTPSPDATKPKR